MKTDTSMLGTYALSLFLLGVACIVTYMMLAYLTGTIAEAAVRAALSLIS